MPLYTLNDVGSGVFKKVGTVQLEQNTMGRMQATIIMLLGGEMFLP